MFESDWCSMDVRHLRSRNPGKCVFLPFSPSFSCQLLNQCSSWMTSLTNSNSANYHSSIHPFIDGPVLANTCPANSAATIIIVGKSGNLGIQFPFPKSKKVTHPCDRGHNDIGGNDDRDDNDDGGWQRWQRWQMTRVTWVMRWWVMGDEHWDQRTVRDHSENMSQRTHVPWMCSRYFFIDGQWRGGGVTASKIVVL